MHFSPILLLHICGGTLGVLSGTVAIFLSKGSRRHAIAGTVFVISMLVLGGSGAYMAILKLQPGNILGGTFTSYLVATSWIAAKRKQVSTGVIDWGALVLVSALTIVGLTLGMEAATNSTGMKYGYPAGPYFFIGVVGLMAATGDVRMLIGHGISGTQRIARHLWRMCFAFFIASASVFIARAHLFPAFMRRTGLLYLLSFYPLVLMTFWMIRIRFARGFKASDAPQQTKERPPSFHGQAARISGF
ncbi:MAG TPA: hypothetical protein VHV29_10200 [Terriglobales bacterium]|nr:hypothetical protein [Terriglobales bacterium]